MSSTSRYFAFSLAVTLAFICLASWARATARRRVSDKRRASGAQSCRGRATMAAGLQANDLHFSISSHHLIRRRRNDFVAAAANGGVLLSTDNGASWRPINTGLPLNEGIGLVAINGKDFYAALMSV